jgi:hypothetical protein
MRKNRFTFICDKGERQLISALAQHLHRSQSDTIRILLFRAAREFELDVSKFTKENMLDGEVRDAK